MCPGRLAGMDTCPRCGWDQRDPYEIVSRHRTSAGEVVYTRCVCGLLSSWLQAGPAAPARLQVRGRCPAA